MARVEIKNLDNVIKSIKRVFDTTVESQKLLNDIGEFTAERIRQQTRIGKDLSDDSKQKSLKPSTILNRQRFAKFPPIAGLSAFFRPRKSNLTLSGQLLDAVGYEVNKATGSVEVLVENTGRTKYRSSDKPLTNQQLQEFLEQQGRTFLGLDPAGEARIQRLVLDELRRNIRRFTT